MLTRNTQISHADITAYVTPFNRMLQDNQAISHYLAPTTSAGAHMLDQVINRQALIIAYNDDYRIMTFFVVPPLLLLTLMRRPNMATPQRAIQRVAGD